MIYERFSDKDETKKQIKPQQYIIYLILTNTLISFLFASWVRGFPTLKQINEMVYNPLSNAFVFFIYIYVFFVFLYSLNLYLLSNKKKLIGLNFKNHNLDDYNFMSFTIDKPLNFYKNKIINNKVNNSN